MRRMSHVAWGLCVLSALSSVSILVAEGQTKLKPDEIIVRTYPVADLAVPVPTANIPTVHVDQSPPRIAPCLEYLMEHLRRLNGPEAWQGKTSVHATDKTLSLVIRQTSAMHDVIADELSHLRRALDVQICLEFLIVTGSRGELAGLAADYAGVLGRAEKEDLIKKVHESVSLKPIFAPKITMFNRTTASVETDHKLIAANAVVSQDRRTIRLKVGMARDGKLHELVANTESLSIHDGRTVAVHFEAERFTPGLEPADDAEELLVIVTPRVIVQEEEEEKIRLGGITPKIIIQEEEEELLGIPTR